MGLPLLNGFVGEFMILQGAFAANRVWAYWAVSGRRAGRGLPALALPAGLLGQDHARGERDASQDLNARELATLVPLVVLCFWIGVYPKPFLDFLHKPAARVARDRPAREVRPNTALAAAPARDPRSPPPAALTACQDDVDGLAGCATCAYGPGSAAGLSLCRANVRAEPELGGVP